MMARSVHWSGLASERRIDVPLMFDTESFNCRMHNDVVTRSIRRPRKSVAARARSADRRSRLRLRDLCDEVLASYRVARERELWSADERDEAKQMLAAVAPRLTY